MDMLAEVLLQIGETERAGSLLQQSIAIAPNGNHVKYLYLAQMQEGTDALASYNTGLQVLSTSVAQADEAMARTTDADMKATYEAEKRRLLAAQCNIYCSIAELYMTDLW